MKIEEFVAGETARGWAYKILSDCYHRPDGELIEKTIALTDIIKTIRPEGESYSDHLRTVLEDNIDRAYLQVDYAKLFLGPFAMTAPPYGSVYLEGKQQLMGNSTLDALKRYREAGLKIADAFKDPPDHITVELEFMSFLIFKEIESITHGGVESADAHFKKQLLFLENHLGAWAPQFADNILQHSETEFYRNLAKLTKVFIMQDIPDVKVVCQNLTPISSNRLEAVSTV